MNASYSGSTMTLHSVRNIGLHYAETLREWRRRFNSADINGLGFDDSFRRAWNYYLTYCEAGFESETEHCLVLVFGGEGFKGSPAPW